MTTPTTCSCGRTTRDGAYVCETCLSSLTRALAEIPWLADELETTITKQGATLTDDGARSTETAVPFHVPAARACRALRHTLVTWIRFCTEEHVRNQAADQKPPADTLTAMSRWLMWRVDGLGLNDLGGDVVTDITNAVAECRRLIDRPAERRYAGPCECGRDLYHRPGATTARCRTCERTYDVGELYEWMKAQVSGRLVTAREGATLLSRFGLQTAQGTVDKWHERKLVLERGHDRAGRRRYLFDDLLTLATRRAA